MLTVSIMQKRKITVNIKILTILNRLRKFMCLKTGFCGMRTKTLSEVPIGNGMNKTLILDGEMPDGDTRYTKKIVRYCRARKYK